MQHEAESKSELCGPAGAYSAKPDKLMNSRFYYPTNTGSLGEPRQAHNFASPIQLCPSSRFQAEHAERTLASSGRSSRLSMMPKTVSWPLTF
jgi:hypothetical protein